MLSWKYEHHMYVICIFCHYRLYRSYLKIKYAHISYLFTAAQPTDESLVSRCNLYTYQRYLFSKKRHHNNSLFQQNTSYYSQRDAVENIFPVSSRWLFFSPEESLTYPSHAELCSPLRRVFVLFHWETEEKRSPLKSGCEKVEKADFIIYFNWLLTG